MLSSFFAKSLLGPKRQPLVKNPKDYGMDFEEVAFKSEDGLNLKGWYIPSNSDKLIIFTHPSPFTRYGFSTKHQPFFKISNIEVELLRTVKHLHDAGYSVLSFDFRNHGESDKGNGGFTGIGMFEWQDVIGAVNYVNSRDDLKVKDLAFVSHCLGANSTIRAISERPELFKRLKCLTAIQPISTDVLTKNTIQDMYPIFAGLYKSINKKAKVFTGMYFEDMAPTKYIKDLHMPVFYVQVKSDPWTQPSDVQKFYDMTKSEKDLLWIEGDLKRFDGYNYFGDHPEKLLAFLKKYI